MTAFAGVVTLDKQRTVAPSLRDALARLITRDPSDRVQVFEGPSYAVVKLDLGILEGEGHCLDEAGALSVIAGEPLLGSGSLATSRSGDLRVLHAGWKQCDTAPLRGARGSFCCAHIDPIHRRVWLVSDKLGIRPIYFAVHDGYLFFSTALRVLEALPVLKKSIDLRGVAEIAAFGFPLGTRSPYANVSAIDAGEIVEFEASGLRRFYYWRWDQLPERRLSSPELTRALFEIFRDAVKRRLGTQRSVAAFLSGGLDSRSIVSCLRHLGADVYTLNFAPLGSADLVLGGLAAKALGSRHFEYPKGPINFWERMRAMHAEWLRELPPVSGPEQPHALWSGDGGSCGLGHIYVTDQIVELMRRGPLDRAIQAYCSYNGIGLPRKAFLHGKNQQLLEVPLTSVREELIKLGTFDEGRRLHLFLMYNGQRRLLARHFEDIDRRRLELITPFFDMQFLELILSSPIDGFLHHRFYHRWLNEFPPETISVPWQAYPGHEPCPLPQPPRLRSQWDSWYTQRDRRVLKREKLDRIGRDLRDPHFPGWLLDKRILQSARWLTRFGVGDYSYMFNVAHEFTRYVARTGR